MDSNYNNEIIKDSLHQSTKTKNRWISWKFQTTENQENFQFNQPKNSEKKSRNLIKHSQSYVDQTITYFNPFSWNL